MKITELLTQLNIYLSIRKKKTYYWRHTNLIVDHVVTQILKESFLWDINHWQII